MNFILILFKVEVKSLLHSTKHCIYSISFLYVCMVNTIYLLSFVETPRKFIIAIINLRGVSTKLNKYIAYICNHVCLCILLLLDKFLNCKSFRLILS